MSGQPPGGRSTYNSVAGQNVLDLRVPFCEAIHTEGDLLGQLWSIAPSFRRKG